MAADKDGGGQVAIFKHGQAPRDTGTRLLRQIRDYIASNPDCQRTTERIRAVMPQGKDAYRRAKNDALSALYGGFNERTRGRLMKDKQWHGWVHSGYVLVEVDPPPGSGVSPEQIKDAALDVEGLRQAATSMSGNGVHFVFEVDPKPETPEDHELAWYVLSERVNRAMAAAGAGAVTADTQAHEMVRLAYLSFDPQVRFYEGVKPAAWIDGKERAAVYRAELKAASKAEREAAKPPRPKAPPRPAYDDHAIDLSAAEHLGCQGGLGPDGYNAWLGMLRQLDTLGFTAAEIAAVCGIRGTHAHCGRVDIIADKILAGLPGSASVDDERNILRGTAYEAGWRQPGQPANKPTRRAAQAEADDGPDPDPERQSPMADAERILVKTPDQIACWDGESGAVEFGVLHPRYRTYTVAAPDARKAAAGIAPAIFAARRLDGSDISFKSGQHTDSPKHYLEVQRSLGDAADKCGTDNLRREDSEPRHYGELPVLVYKDGSGGIDMATGLDLAPDAIQRLYLETPPWPAIRRPDWAEFRRVQSLSEPLALAEPSELEPGLYDITPAEGGSMADVADYLWWQLPGLINLYAWLLSGQQRVLPEVVSDDPQIGKSTAAELVQKAFGKGVSVKQAYNLLSGKGRGAFDDIQRLCSQHFLVVVDEVAKAGQVQTGLVNELTASGFEPNVKYERRKDVPRRANALLLGDRFGLQTNRDAQGVKERLSYLLDFTGNGALPLSRATRNALLASQEAADYTACLVLSCIQNGQARPPEGSREAAAEKAALGDDFKQALSFAFKAAPGVFTPSAAVSEVIREVAKETGRQAPSHNDLTKTMETLFPAAERCQQRVDGKPTRGWLGIQGG